jgi:hypothetical protein
MHVIVTLLFFTLNPLPGNINLPLNHLPSRSTDGFPLFNTILKVKHLHYIICKVFRQLFPLLHAKVGNLDTSLFG